ncbi:unnamed protein product [Linum trigynum]|uniref:Reverse transcriptase Ty1/copia-type domain-containing protein n=1 Tax=Linum trigynum TaxID=586398 RepID=A0AAV2D843_9ROSI
MISHLILFLLLLFLLLHLYPPPHLPTQFFFTTSCPSINCFFSIPTCPTPSTFSFSFSSPATPPPTNQPPLRHFDRHIKPPTHLVKEYHYYLSQSSSSASDQLQQQIPRPMYALSSMVSYDKLTPSYRKFVLGISSYQGPNSYKEASQLEDRNNAMKQEVKDLLKNQTWDVVELPPGKKPIGNKWVYRIKVPQDGSSERFKARVIAKGNTEQEGVDYQDTSAPVIKMTIIRTFLAIAALRNWHIHKLDVNNAFLHGDLQEEVHMTLPKGYDPPPCFINPICRLKKSLYGLSRHLDSGFQNSQTNFNKLVMFQVNQIIPCFIKPLIQVILAY